MNPSADATPTSLLGRFRALSWRDRGLRLEAFGTLALARALVLCLPFRRVAAMLGETGVEGPRNLPAPQEATARAIGWSVASAARFVPWDGLCLTQALAGWLMLRRRGLHGTVYFGVAQDPANPGRKNFHAWLRCGSRSVTGGDGHRHYQVLTCFSRRIPAPKRRQPRPAVIWFTGLSGSGKSTLAQALEARLLLAGCAPVRLDGDDLREGLCKDLAFSPGDREENIRRAGEVARLMYRAGHLVLCSFISPFQAHRDQARALIPAGRFFEVHVKCSLETCRRRDPKGLYGRVDKGQVGSFTGVSSPYEVPERPELVLDTEGGTPDELVEQLWRRLVEAGILGG